MLAKRLADFREAQNSWTERLTATLSDKEKARRWDLVQQELAYYVDKFLKGELEWNGNIVQLAVNDVALRLALGETWKTDLDKLR